MSSWPDAMVRVQALSESGIEKIPENFVRHLAERPGNSTSSDEEVSNIPLVDFSEVNSSDHSIREKARYHIHNACCEWGFFQLINHGVSHDLIKTMEVAWRGFFNLPLCEKEKYANDPITYEGYGSRVGTHKDSKLDWNDYFFLHLLPESLRNENKWPSLPDSCRKTTSRYGQELLELSKNLLQILSENIGLNKDYFSQTFGGDSEIGATLRVNYYPKCPQPDLTLGLSPHSDPGGITLLLSDSEIGGLQVRRGNNWITVKPLPNAFVVNLGDQIQVLSNAIYKSVEHRVIVNPVKERFSLAFFCNPGGDRVIKPADELVTKDQPSLYPPMTFKEYRAFIRTKGLHGKSQLEQLKSST